MIGLGIGVGWATKRRLVNYINELIKQFKDRVAADGGTFEAEQCLKNTLNTLGIVVPPTVVTAPVISGSTAIGSVISTTNGVFDGVTPITYTYQWLLDGSPILGATSSTYTTENSGTLTCKVTATNDFGSASSISNSLEIEPFDSDYQAILDYATTQGYTLPSDSQKLLQNQLLIDLKDAGVWNKLDTFANFATDGSSNFALIDWKNLTQYTAVNSPTFTTNVGFLTNGTSSYINTNKMLGTNFTLNSASEFKWVNNAIDNNSANVSSGARGTLGGNLYEVTGFNVAINSVAVSGFTNNLSAGLRHIDRKNSITIERFVNGVVSSVTQNSTFVVDRAPFIGCFNNGTPSGFESNSFSFYGFGASLSSESSNLYNAINTYKNSI